MNDRYLYRAKRTDNWEWVEGYYVKRHGVPMIYENRDCPQSIYEIDPSTICQCTGLKDKNGKLIWENDIMMCHGNKKDLCKVCFGEFKVIDIENMVAVDIVQGWYYRPLKTDGLSKCEPFCYEMPLTNYYLERMETEVIGSAIDNPELLEVGLLHLMKQSKKEKEYADCKKRQAEEPQRLFVDDDREKEYRAVIAKEAAEARKRAEWLEELKSYRDSVFSGDMTQKMLKEEYCKAVDDFAESVKNLIAGSSVIRFKDIDEISEQLKAGDGE